MEDLFVCNKTQAKLKLVKVNSFLIIWIVWIMTTTKVLGLFNFSQALENSIWIAQRTIGIRRVAAYTRVRSWIHIILTKKKFLVKKNVVWNSTAFARSDNVDLLK